MKNVMIGIAVVASIMAILFVLGLFELGMFKFFAPKRENVRREVFENTKSYTHGVAMDLGKYMHEYRTATTVEEKQAIEAVIRTRFASFDASKLQSPELRLFLTNTRGY